MNNETEIMRLPDVIKLVGIAKDTIYKLMRQGKFPRNKAMKDLPSRRIWLRSECLAWLNGQWSEMG